MHLTFSATHIVQTPKREKQIALGALFISDNEVIKDSIRYQTMLAVQYATQLILEGKKQEELIARAEKFVSKQNEELNSLSSYLKELRNN